MRLESDEPLSRRGALVCARSVKLMEWSAPLLKRHQRAMMEQIHTTRSEANHGQL